MVEDARAGSGVWNAPNPRPRGPSAPGRRGREAGKGEPAEGSLAANTAGSRVTGHRRQRRLHPGALRCLETPSPDRARLAVGVTEHRYARVGLLAQAAVRFADLPVADLVGGRAQNPMGHGMGTERRAETRRTANLVPADGRELGRW